MREKYKPRIDEIVEWANDQGVVQYDALAQYCESHDYNLSTYDSSSFEVFDIKNDVDICVYGSSHGTWKYSGYMK